MNNYYFILNKKEHVLITADDEQLARQVFYNFSLYNKGFRNITQKTPEYPSKQVEQIKQRQ